MLLRNSSFPRIDDSIISDIPRLSPLHFTPRSVEEKSRLIEAIHNRGSLVDSVESNLEQVKNSQNYSNLINKDDCIYS